MLRPHPTSSKLRSEWRSCGLAPQTPRPELTARRGLSKFDSSQLPGRGQRSSRDSLFAMFKRRDWAHLHGTDDAQDEAEESSSSSEDEASEPGSSMEQEPENEGVEEDASARRLEDLSEDDFDGAPSSGSEGGQGKEDEDADSRRSFELEKLLREWLSAEDPAKLKGEALTCRLCADVLILNAANLQQHMKSRRHQKGLRKQPEATELLDQICLAGDISDPEEEGETFHERLERLRSMDVPPAAVVAAEDAADPALEKTCRDSGISPLPKIEIFERDASPSAREGVGYSFSLQDTLAASRC
ncbi:hypothetical protein WJX84_007204 [Apatococcus fuscideae]|uniref:U1-type domain-containing protein n=1 Tax=Apatococcus fuscideae TaxID=2026836 RepID=A0AAW1TAZ6_9CHLO